MLSVLHHSGIIIFFLRYLGLNSGPSLWATPPALLLWRVFWDKVSQNYLPGLSSNLDPSDLTSWVARISGVNHQRPASGILLSLTDTREPYFRSIFYHPRLHCTRVEDDGGRWLGHGLAGGHTTFTWELCEAGQGPAAAAGLRPMCHQRPQAISMFHYAIRLHLQNTNPKRKLLKVYLHWLQC
jgi:hypothetical protein